MRGEHEAFVPIVTLPFEIFVVSYVSVNAA